jgi:hypothetical protein
MKEMCAFGGVWFIAFSGVRVFQYPMLGQSTCIVVFARYRIVPLLAPAPARLVKTNPLLREHLPHNSALAVKF